MTKHGIIAAVVAVGAALFFFRKKTVQAADGTNVALSSNMEPASVKEGETVSVKNYREIESQRSGMTYAPVGAGTIGQQLAFKVTKTGKFTRNVVSDGQGGYLAEIA